ncbi:hypothetical protein [Amaricoccus sp.]|uniref:hypothetical protein n=1 Tax=Amaricoccus sp. TaxID=1872485 RepID=UPI001B78DD99|nr:hypothetical protein [Amaricoccus sp.]MBP7242857.1 hypothetical protein [Amaricoccus sp.]
MSIDLPPDPFEDLAAPTMRLGPRLPRPVLVHSVEPAGPEPDAVSVATVEDLADHPFELARTEPEEAEAPAPDPETPPSFESVLEGEADVLSATARAVPAAPRASGSRGLQQLRAAVVVGLLTAVAIVALAVIFRPESLETGAAPAATPTALGSGPVPAPAAEAASPVAAVSVRLRVDPDLSAPRRAALEAAVSAAGYGDLEASPTTAPIDRGRIEYFHAADKDAAEALARSLAPLTGGPTAVHDLSAVTLGAAPGRIDAWIAD